MIIAKSQRLTLRHLSRSDAEFILHIYNTEGFLRFIGDRNIRSLSDARDFLTGGPLKMYKEHGISLYRVEHNDSGKVVGLCGLIKRDTLDDIDLGYAFLPEHCGNGYALEAAKLSLDYAKAKLGLDRVVAITQVDNLASISLLKKLGMQREGSYVNGAGQKEEVEIDIYGLNLRHIKEAS
ncbi:MAG: GNAT family N-acetyltransferase [Pseudomonadales bacterium]|nr:GNAT family N-acetyltransferase [Pseudomonadales bacterium]